MTMTKIKKCFAFAVVWMLIFSLFEAGPSFADELAVKGGGLYRVNAAGKETLVKDAYLSSIKDVEGVGYWIGVDPESEERYKGMDGGIYFFDEDGKFITFFESEEADRGDVFFSPGGQYVTLNFGTYADRFYQIFLFETEEPVEEFYGMMLKWLDSESFAFTYIDESKGDRSENSDITGWFSVAVYDVRKGKLETVKAATQTEDYQLTDVDTNAKKLVIEKISVQNARDWANEEKRKTEETRAPIPAR